MTDARTKGEVIALSLLRRVEKGSANVQCIKTSDGVLSFKVAGHSFMITRTSAYIRQKKEPGTLHLFVIEDEERTQVLRQRLSSDIDDWGTLQRLSNRIHEIHETRRASQATSIIDRVYYVLTEKHIYDGGRA